ncbi:hypothetical protein [Halocatena pleomorpha]|uniref:Uncharacterized protein n=1 Tax=Halocatena pleomorpha TaxID=1785090 RepID=A0A3P3R619_9EURY|nr:hypothetical protein [Halocatena pleomorpha]RRJ28428.1 hypothetical protein EIK79_15765 [Halocatena pleomorpha]
MDDNKETADKSTVTVKPTGSAGAWDAYLRRDETEAMDDIEAEQRDDGQWRGLLDGEVVTVQSSRGKALDMTRVTKEEGSE